MTYTPETGDVADAAWRSAAVTTFAGNYPVEPAPKASIGDSTTSIEIGVSAGVVVFGNDVETPDQQTVTLPDGPAPGSAPDGGDPARVDLITIDSNGNAGRMVGQPAVPKPAERRFPNVTQPVPQTPHPADDVVVIAAVWVLAGTGSSAGMFADWIIPREVMGGGLNDLQLIPGRDLQYQLDTTREGETLRGDRSQTITLSQPLTVSTPRATIRDLDLRYADGAATANTDDMLTIDAPGVAVENITLDGNKQNQPADADGITATANADNVTARDIVSEDIAGYTVNLNGGSGGNALLDPDVESVKATTPQKGALVVQGSVFRASAEKVSARNPASGGAVLVRNGPTGTTLDTIFTTDGDYALALEDFGGGNDASAPITDTRASGVRVENTPQAVVTDTAEIGHRELRLSNVRGRNWPQTQAAPIDLNNLASVTIQNSSIRGYHGAQGIRAENASTLTVTGTTVARPQTAGGSGIFVRDSGNATITGGTVVAGGSVDMAAGILLLVRGSQVMSRAKVTNTSAYDIGGGPGIKLDESEGSTFRRSLVKNNNATVESGATGPDMLVKDNLPP